MIQFLKKLWYGSFDEYEESLVTGILGPPVGFYDGNYFVYYSSNLRPVGKVIFEEYQDAVDFIEAVDSGEEVKVVVKK